MLTNCWYFNWRFLLIIIVHHLGGNKCFGDYIGNYLAPNIKICHGTSWVYLFDILFISTKKNVISWFQLAADHPFHVRNMLYSSHEVFSIAAQPELDKKPTIRWD